MKISYKIPVNVFKEDDKYVAYTPVLDLATSGSTLKETQRRFHEAVVLFFEEIYNAGTADEVLTSLGWKKAKKSSSTPWIPPEVISNRTETFRVPAVS
jgi:hypothetical protein